ncbi:MAG: hypothetical protein KGN00_03955 [Chloroflexota bacterium]|nr:hypothetical protein [Chloroflexota bacterium]MDE3192824.1 hypothetical protein [Chloroflexota bacterium]
MHVRTVVCAYSREELPTSWLQVFRRFERAFEKAKLDVRVRLDPLEDLPDDFEILVVPARLRRRADELAQRARVVPVSRETAAGAAGALIAEIERGDALRADALRSEAPRAVHVRGMREL